MVEPFNYFHIFGFANCYTFIAYTKSAFMKNIMLIIATVLLPILCFSQQEFENTLQYNESDGSPKATILEVAWIAGHWIGEAMGGQIEEVWTPSLGKAMMGSFKLVADGKVVFYEIETITEENESVILRLKHFNADLKGWEEKEETEDFKLVKITDDAVYFDQLTFKKVDDNHLNIYVVIGNEGKQDEVLFEYKRKE